MGAFGGFLSGVRGTEAVDKLGERVKAKRKPAPVSVAPSESGVIGGEASGMNSEIDSYKSGGRVKRTGLALLHKGEEVIPAGRAKQIRKRLTKRF